MLFRSTGGWDLNRKRIRYRGITMLCHEPPYYATCMWWFATETPLPSLPYPVGTHVWDILHSKRSLHGGAAIAVVRATMLHCKPLTAVLVTETSLPPPYILSTYMYTGGWGSNTHALSRRTLRSTTTITMKSTKVQTLGAVALHATTACTDEASIKFTQLDYSLVSCLVWHAV